MLKDIFLKKRFNGINLFVISGQSNANDRVTNTELQSFGLYKEFPKIKKFTGSHGYVIGTGNTFENYNSTLYNVGLEVSMLDLISTSRNQDVYFVKAAVDSTPIVYVEGTNTWNVNITGTYSLFEKEFYKGDNSATLEKAYNVMMSLFPGKEIRIVMVWVQGENDATANSTSYLSDITAIKNKLKVSFNKTSLLFFYLRLNLQFSQGNPVNIRNAQNAFASNENKIIIADDLEMDAGKVHYPTASYVEIGNRFGNKFLRT